VHTQATNYTFDRTDEGLHCSWWQSLLHKDVEQQHVVCEWSRLFSATYTVN